MEEVIAKKSKIEEKPDKEWHKLEADPIKVIRGPGGGLYITDHHHGADAWRLANRPNALCQIADRPVPPSDADFWSGLIKDGLVHLFDAKGREIAPTQLPPDLQSMQDDPYRSLAWRVRKENGFCRGEMRPKEFAEFQWANWMRKQAELPLEAVAASTLTSLPTALALVKSPAAANVPGFLGDNTPPPDCQDDS